MAVPQYSAVNGPFVNADGRLSFAASVFLREMWIRAGGAIAPTNNELEAMIDGYQLGVFRAREAPQSTADVAYVQAFARPTEMPVLPPSIPYIAAFLPRVQEQTTPLEDACAVICSRVFAAR